MAFPAGFGLAIDPSARRIDDGTVMVGGAPLRLLRLTRRGAEVVDRFAAGDPISASGGAQRLARRLLDAGLAHPRPPTGYFSPADVTVVIPVRDDPAGLESTLRSFGSTHDSLGGVVVVDDGSRAPVKGAIRHGKSRGPAAARNTGWRTASTAVVAFVDAECVPATDWLDRLLPHFADPQVAAVAPRIIAAPRPGLLGRYETVQSPLDRGPAEGPVRPRGRVPFVPTAVLLVRRSALEQLGGFDETMRFGEDVDLVWRLAESNRTVRYEPATSATHPARPGWCSWLRQRFEYGRSAAPLGQRHGAAVAPLAVSAWSAAAWTAVGLGWPVAGAGLAAATTAMLKPRLTGLDHPWSEATRLAGRGHLHAGRQVAEAVRRAWWPIAVVAALGSRRARIAIAATMIPIAADWMSTRPPIDPLRWLLIRLADDVSYGAGVWVGCWQTRSAIALTPDLASWPGRRAAVESA